MVTPHPLKEVSEGCTAVLHYRLKNTVRAQQNALEKSQAMQDDMADVLLSLKV